MDILGGIKSVYERVAFSWSNNDIDASHVSEYLEREEARLQEAKSRLTEHNQNSRSWAFWSTLLVEAFFASLVVCLALGAMIIALLPDDFSHQVAAATCVIVNMASMLTMTFRHFSRTKRLSFELETVTKEQSEDERLGRADRIMRAVGEHRRLLARHQSFSYASSGERDKMMGQLRGQHRALQLAVHEFQHGSGVASPELVAVMEEIEDAELVKAAWREIDDLCSGRHDPLAEEITNLSVEAAESQDQTVSSDARARSRR